MATVDPWTKTAAPVGYDGDCYCWGNYLAASAWDGKYRLNWHLLRRQEGGRFQRVAASGAFTQTFAIRPFDQRDVEQALRWAEKEIVLYRGRRKEPDSDFG